MGKNLFVSAMRTLVPWGVALVLSLTGSLGIPVDSEAAGLVVLIGLGAAYYLAFRALEAIAERIAWRPLQIVAGVFLGWARPPAYERSDQAPMDLDMHGLARDVAELKRALGMGGDSR